MPWRNADEKCYYGSNKKKFFFKFRLRSLHSFTNASNLIKFKLPKHKKKSEIIYRIYLLEKGLRYEKKFKEFDQHDLTQLNK